MLCICMPVNEVMSNKGKRGFIMDKAIDKNDAKHR